MRIRSGLGLVTLLNQRGDKNDHVSDSKGHGSNRTLYLICVVYSLCSVDASSFSRLWRSSLLNISRLFCLWRTSVEMALLSLACTKKKTYLIMR